MPQSRGNPFLKAYQVVVTAFAFSYNMESAKLSVKRGDLSIPKARKCQIYKQFTKDYRFPTTKVRNCR